MEIKAFSDLETHTDSCQRTSLSSPASFKLVEKPNAEDEDCLQDEKTCSRMMWVLITCNLCQRRKLSHIPETYGFWLQTCGGMRIWVVSRSNGKFKAAPPNFTTLPQLVWNSRLNLFSQINHSYSGLQHQLFEIFTFLSFYFPAIYET